MAPYFANQSCDPFQPPSSQCVVGSYIQYAIDVQTKEDVVAGLKFASEKNIRLVVRNTGHDYNGRSTGSGALGLWMHHLKDLELVDYEDAYYSGKAIKMAAGVQGWEAYELADANGLQVVGGECPTVGLAGGYTQGGGHSALMSKHGLAADQALEWEVITAQGEYLIANRDQNSDLYWALSGGGGGTYAVVLSLTSKAHPDTHTTGLSFSFTSDNTTLDAYYTAVAAYHAALPALSDAGAFSNYWMSNASFAIDPMIAPDLTSEEVVALMAPVTETLDALGIPYKASYKDYPTYLSAFNDMFPELQVNILQYGGRLIPRSVVEETPDALIAAIRTINARGAQFIGATGSTSLAVAGDVDNAVLPGWRTSLIDGIITTPWNFSAPFADMRADQDRITNELMPPLEAITPPAAYMNEGNFRQPDWQEVFYGENYARLLEIKDKYDPEHLFYALTAVGSEYWVEETEFGRLCRAGSDEL